ncbi:putative 3-hydroxyphenylpropionic transporter MhpT [Streptococcus intermedius]|uniref:MFS transporter n=1 Tax=Streptococcus intermedius TaxID=1338 RepID=UPI000E3E85A5|nr:MFS transporter [Streptococcus intermedius]RSJ10258.1 putative 3-hydroxyphenylpropionic transporter MhpT [Streptococcus intermedius]RSJ15846.1 putative 3-hydroxyphenylpropionic transporter MhpT [Streptococcus intermedius]RSJ29966.1 putative 3-hydroxyphenylpropionic transporter MhpT [Streptococcus intermedius]
MKRFMEKASILALSLVLTTAFSISSSLPAMFQYYKNYSSSQVELLVSLPSIGIMSLLMFNSVLERFVSEQFMIILGLILYSICGLIPFFNQSYNLVFASRFVFGLGLGMMNPRAIAIISERFQGRERVQMMGYRGSAEVVGTALLTLIVGQLLRFNWTTTFWVYAIGFIVLALYLMFVPYEKNESDKHKHLKSVRKMTRKQIHLSIFLAFIAGMIVCTNVAITLRIPSLVLQAEIGNAETASWILSCMQLVGILAGVSFASLVNVLKNRLLTITGIVFGLSQIMIGLSSQIYFLSLSALLAGFAYSISLTAVFHIISEKIPAYLVNRATAIVVLGCSSGASVSTFVLSLIGIISSTPTFIFSVLGVLMMGISTLAAIVANQEDGEKDAIR